MERLNKRTAILLRRAAAILAEFGLAKGGSVDPYTEAVDVCGALQLACGISRHRLKDDFEDILSTLPQAHLPAFLEAWVALEATKENLTEWQDSQSTCVDEVVRLLHTTADHFEKRIIDP